MQKLYAGALLAIAMPLAAHDLVPGGGHFALVATSLAVAAGSNFVQGFQMPCSSHDNGEVICTFGQETLEESSYRLLQARKDKQRQLQKRQAQAKMCKKLERKKEADLIRERVRVQKEAGVKPDVIDSLAVTVADFRDTLDHVRGEVLSSEAPAICPQEGEDLSVYVARLTNIISTEVSEIKSMESVQDLFEHDFWDLPWSMKRFLLAVNIDVGLLDVNDVLPVSKLTPLDHALEHDDLEMVTFLLDHDGQPSKMVKQDFFGFVKEMIKHSNEKSSDVLKRFDLSNAFPADHTDRAYSTGHVFNHGNSALRRAAKSLFAELAVSAKHQRAESVKEKFDFILRALPNRITPTFIHGDILSCPGACDPEFGEKETPGEQAFIDAKKKACEVSGCIIL